MAATATASQTPTTQADIERHQRRERWVRRLPLLPALLITIVITQVPFLFSLYYSFTNWTVVPPGPREFVGFENYIRLVSDRFFLEAAWVSVMMTVGAVLLSLILGTAIAVLLDRQFFGRGFVRTLLITPFLVMPVVAGLLWRTQMFSSLFGVLNWVLEAVGLQSIAFVQRAPLGTIVTVLVWQWTPFMMLIVLAGLQGQDTSILEAAEVDGAKPLAVFRQITLPHLRPFLELGTLLGSIYLIQVFDHIEVMTGGGPGSTNIPYFVFQRSIGGGWRFGDASAYAVVVVIASIIIAVFSLRVLSGLLEDRD